MGVGVLAVLFLVLQLSLTLVENDAPPVANLWQAVTAPSPEPDSYLSVSQNDGSKRQWVFNPESSDWERVKKIYGWKALDAKVVPLTKLGDGGLESDSWSASISWGESKSVRLGGGGGYSLSIPANVQYSLTERLGLDIGGPWDPTHVIQPTPGVRWGGVRLIETVQFVQQSIHDEQGAEHSTPVGLPLAETEGAAGERLVTRTRLLKVPGESKVIEYYSANTATIIYKEIQP